MVLAPAGLDEHIQLVAPDAKKPRASAPAAWRNPCMTSLAGSLSKLIQVFSVFLPVGGSEFPSRPPASRP